MTDLRDSFVGLLWLIDLRGLFCYVASPTAAIPAGTAEAGSAKPGFYHETRFPSNEGCNYLNELRPTIVVALDTVNVVYSVPGVYVPPVYRPSVTVPVELPP